MPLKAEFAFSVGDPTDDSQSALALTLTGSPAVAGGKNGGGLQTSDVQYADFPGIPGVSGLVTIMGWYKLSATTGFARSLFKNGSWAAQISTFSGAPRLFAYDYGLTATTLSVSLPNDTNWHHWAMTFGTGANIPVALFVDGVQVNNDVFAGSTAINLVPTFRIGGSDPDGLGGTGTITQDDFRVFNEILTAGQITTWMNTAGPTAGPASVNGALLSNTDLEMLYLASLGATGVTLADRRFQIYGANQHAYFAARSGLAPASFFSLNDHMYAYFKGAATAWTEKRRNLANSPAPGVGLNGWAASNATVSAAADGAFLSGSYARGLVTNSVPAIDVFVYHSFVGENVVPSATQVAVSAYARTSTTRDLQLRLAERNSGGTTGGLLVTPGVAATPGAVVRVAHTLTTLASTVSLSVGVRGAATGGDWAISDTLDASSFLIELGSVYGTYFDGNSTPGSALEQYRWTGPTNDSPSVFETRLSNVASDGSLADVQRRFWLLSLGL